jgi:predicted MFS family arabinose efflux permease
MTDPAPAGNHLGLWLALSLMTLVQAFATMATLTVPTIAPEVGTALNLPVAAIGYQVSLIFLGAVVTSLYGGVLVRRFGACLVSQTALTATAAGCLLLATADLAAAVLGSLALGFGYGMTNPAASHLLARVAGARINLVFSIKQAGVPLGGVAAGILMPQVTLALGWQAALLTAAAMLGALVLALMPLRRRWDDDREPGRTLFQRPFQALALVLSAPVLRWLAASSFAFAFVQTCVSAFLVSMLVGDFRFGLVAAGLLLSVTQIAGFVGRLAWGLLADWLDDGVATLAIVAGLMVVAAGLTAMTGPTWPIWAIGAVFFLFGASALGWNGIFLAAVARASVPGQVGTATGGGLSVTFAGVMVGPTTFAAVHTGLDIDFAATYGLLTLVAGAGLVCLWLARRARLAA